MSPATAMPGQAVTFTTQTTRAGDMAGVVLSNQILAAPLLVLPFGPFEVNPGVLLPVASGAANAQCSFVFSVPLANDPGLRGISFAFMAVTGNSFGLRLSNGVAFAIR